jgi:hypothetical protein
VDQAIQWYGACMHPRCFPMEKNIRQYQLQKNSFEIIKKGQPGKNSYFIGIRINSLDTSNYLKQNSELLQLRGKQHVCFISLELVT